MANKTVDVLVRAKADVSQAERQLRSLEKQKITLDAYVKVKRDIKNQSVRLDIDTKKLALVQKQIADVTSQIEKKKHRLAIETDGTKIQNLLNQIDKLEEKKFRLEIREEGLFNSIDRIKTRLKDLEKEKIRLEAKTDTKDAEKRLDALNDEAVKLKQQLAEKMQVYVDTEDALRGIEALKDRIESIRNIGQGMQDFGTNMLNGFGLFDNMFGNAFKQMATGIWRYTGGSFIRKIYQTIGDTFSGAIGRYDTVKMNKNILKEAYGFSDSAISSLDDQIQETVLGLPTGLDQAYSDITKLFASNFRKNGGIDRAIKVFDALDKGVLAFGGDVENVEGVIGAMIKIMDKGFIEEKKWDMLRNNKFLPALDAVAEYLGYETTADMKADFGKDGTRDIQEFIDGIIGANEVGSEAIPAFSKTVEKANETIERSVSIMQQRLQQGWTKVIESADKLMASETGKSIFQHIRNLGQFGKDIFTDVANWIDNHQTEIGTAVDWLFEKIEKLKSVLTMDNITSFIGGFIEGLPIDEIKSFAKVLGEILTSVGSFLGGGDVGKGLGKLFAGYYSVAKGFQFVGGLVKGLAVPLALVTTLLGKGKGLKLGKLGNLFGGDGLLGSLKSMLFGKGGTQASWDDIKMKGVNSFINVATLWGYAQVMKEFGHAIKIMDESIPDDMTLGQFASKMGKLVSAMGVFKLFGDGISKLEDKVFGMNYFDQTMSSLTNFINSQAMKGFAEGIKTLNESMPDNMDVFWDKFKGFSAVLAEMTTFTWVGAGINSLGGGLGALFTVLSEWEMYFQGDVLKNIASGIASIDKAMPDDVSKFIPKMQALADVIRWVDSNFDFGFFNAIGQSYKAENSGQVQETIDSLVGMAKSLDKLKDVKLTGADAKIDILNHILGKLVQGEGLSQAVATLADGLKETNMDKVNSFFDFLGGVPEKLNAFKASMDANGGIELGDFKKKSEPIKDILEYLSDEFVETIPGFSGGQLALIDNASKAMEKFGGLYTAVQSLASIYNSKEKPADIDVEGMKSMVSNLTSALSPLMNASVLKKGQTHSRPEGWTMGQLQGADMNLTLTQALENLPSEDVISNAINAFNGIKGLIDAMSNLGALYAPNASQTNIEEAMKKVTSALEAIVNSGIKDYLQDIKDLEIGTMQTAVDNLKTMLTSLQEIGTMNFKVGAVGTDGTIANVVNEIKNAISEIATLKGYEDMANAEGGIAGVQAIVDSMKTAIEGLSSLAEPADVSGQTIADALINGFSKVETEIPAKVESGADAISTKKFKTKGSKAGTTFSDAFKNALDLTVSEDKISLPDVTGLATTLAGQFNTAFNSSINLSVNAPSVKGSSISNSGLIDWASQNSAGGKQHGGPVTQYLSRGSLVKFVPRGTDTVPTMLTPGEFVVRKKAVNKFGTSMLEKLNNMDVKGLYNEFVNGFGSSQMELNRNNTVINNYNTTNNDHRTVNINGGMNERQDRIKAGRFMRSIA